MWDNFKGQSNIRTVASGMTKKLNIEPSRFSLFRFITDKRQRTLDKV